MIQLDTHSLLWLVLEPEKISSPATSAIETLVQAGGKIAVSVITLWEIAHLARRGRIHLNVPIEEFLEAIEANYRVIPLTRAIVIQAAKLPEPFPKDPMDRLITATAMVEDFSLVTRDRAIHQAKVCKLVW
jgi:PIN domain nuclease of toxin-antitoxin system